MKLAPVLPLRKKSRTKQRVEGLLRLFRGKKSKAAAEKSMSARPAPRSTLPPRSQAPRSTDPHRVGTAYPTRPPQAPTSIDAQAALMGDPQEAPTIPAPPKAGKKQRKPKKNPFLSTPVPDTFRPPAQTAPLPPVKPPPLPNLPSFGTLQASDAPRVPEAPAPHLRSNAPVSDAAAAHVSGGLASQAFPPISNAALKARAPSAPITAPDDRARPSPKNFDSARWSAPSLAPMAVARQARTTVPMRAVAVAHEKSNAVGTIELSCTAAGLQIQFVRISAYTDGYVPYPTTSSERVTVPYEQVARVEVDGDGLVHLTVDASCTPYSRMVLAGLVRDPSFDHVASHRARARIERNVTLAALVVWIPVALMLRAAAPNMSALFVMGIAASIGALLHIVRRDVAAKLVLFNRSSEQVRDELLSELRFRLAPGRVRSMPMPSDVPAPEAAPAALGEPEGAEAGGLRGLFVTAGVVGAAAAIAILVGKNLLFSSPPEPDAQWGKDQDQAWAWLDRDEKAASSNENASTNAAASIAPDPTPIIPPPSPCSCDRSDSPLWADGLPRMSILAHNRPGPTSYDRPSVYPEIAVVNNSSEDLKDIVMVVDFLLAARDGRKARVVDKQDLFWEGRLAPGKAVKWRVRGRGDDYSVTSFVSGMIGQDDVKTAPADAFYKLSITANTPSVRLHGTKMLAYLGDERVSEGLEKLREEGREDMADTVEQIALAARPLRVCSVSAQLDPNNKGQMVVKACVFNAGPTEVPQAMVTAHAKLLDASNENRWALREGLRSKTGIITAGTVEVPRADDAADPKTTMVRVVAER